MPEPVDLRILQANERTLLAWIRTGLALMAFGFVAARLSMWIRFEQGAETAHGSLALGIAVILVGVACEVFGALRFVAARRALLRGESPVPGAVSPVLVAILVAAIGAALLVYLVVS